MKFLRKPQGIASQNARLLLVAFLAFELFIALMVVNLVIIPMARRSASDFTSLVLLSVESWHELPPAARPSFESELAHQHQLALRSDPPYTEEGEWHGFYLHFVESALAQRTGRLRHLVQQDWNGEAWWWIAIPSPEGDIGVGFPVSRVQTHPLFTLALSSITAIVLSLFAARWLARRTVAPLISMEQAVTRLGRGEAPAQLDESGPTELAALAARFNAMARQVQELLNARTLLLAGLSHDLRSPLARMRLAVTLLEEHPSAKTLARLDKDISEMDLLIGNTLELARGLAGETPHTLALDALLHELAETARSPERVSIDCPPLPVSVPPLALRRAIGNLLENALKHSNGQVEIQASHSADSVRIDVLDRGPGIPPDKRDDVFQAFYRLDASRSPATGGAGLGLAIVRQLATQNGWRISLDTRPGGGLLARLEIPA